MKTTLIIAWRNIWRNKRRSLITIAAIFMAVLLSVFMRSMQKGSYEMMIQGGINQVGYLQIHKNGYWDNQSINKAMILTPKVEQKIGEVENISDINPKFMNFGLASSGEQTKAAMIMGILPQKEDDYSGLSKKTDLGQLFKRKRQWGFNSREIGRIFKTGRNRIRFYNQQKRRGHPKTPYQHS
jgi:ABC-type lipoprotein release transport system permease subunit